MSFSKTSKKRILGDNTPSPSDTDDYVFLFHAFNIIAKDMGLRVTNPLTFRSPYDDYDRPVKMLIAKAIAKGWLRAATKKLDENSFVPMKADVWSSFHHGRIDRNDPKGRGLNGKPADWAYIYIERKSLDSFLSHSEGGLPPEVVKESKGGRPPKSRTEAFAAMDRAFKDGLPDRDDLRWKQADIVRKILSCAATAPNGSPVISRRTVLRAIATRRGD